MRLDFLVQTDRTVSYHIVNMPVCICISICICMYLIIEEDCTLREPTQDHPFKIPCGDHVRNLFSLYSLSKAEPHAIKFLLCGSFSVFSLSALPCFPDPANSSPQINILAVQFHGTRSPKIKMIIIINFEWVYFN